MNVTRIYATKRKKDNFLKKKIYATKRKKKEYIKQKMKEKRKNNGIFYSKLERRK